MILKKTVAHNFFWFNSFQVLAQTKLVQNRVPESGHATVKYFIEILKFLMFLKQAQSQFFFLKIVLVY